MAKCKDCGVMVGSFATLGVCDECLEHRRAVRAGEIAPPVLVPASMTSTLAELPGYRIAAVLGLVSGTGSATIHAGNAADKGRSALGDAQVQLASAGGLLGAGAILGVTVSAYGASIGGGMGDAVGVTLMGTAVTVEPLA